MLDLSRLRWPRSEPRQVPLSAAPGRVLRVFRVAALTAISVIITAADSAAFAESYRGLWVWARNHGLSGFWAAAFPLQVDTFIVVASWRCSSRWWTSGNGGTRPGLGP
jgi:Protein of unknown function (DUF2637)